jgi:predicted AlkP superfamily phosphohydrolase/phosphomutase
VATAVVLAPSEAHAYVGPGAGFALVSSFLTFLIAFFTAFFAIFTFPIRWLIRKIRQKKPEGPRKVKKVVILGLDGLDPKITEQMMEKGELANFRKLRDTGTYRHLGTSNPAMSPVAWSTFSTGADASYHGIFDFLTRDRNTYLPKTSSSAVYGSSKFFKLGPWRIPLKKGGVRFLRKAVSFWTVLGDYGVFSTVLRVPITFPPERFNGLMIAGMDVPDLRGTMGTFTYYTQSEDEAKNTAGTVIKLTNGDSITTTIPGPTHPETGKAMEVPMVIHRANGGARITVAGETLSLKEREYSPWVTLTYKAAANIKLTGIVRFYITRLNGDLGLYMTPIHIDPDKPVMPISSPAVYSSYLAKNIGPFATLGLAEDTWALNERVIEEDGWLDQAYLFYEERRKMWFHSLERLRKGMLCCVFDISDRLQHMTFRYLDDDHPANAGKDTTKHKDALFDMYREMDKLLAETLEYIDKDTALFVISDHGFKTFKRGLNINSWLRDEGYLALKEGEDGSGEYLTDVDWSKTRAYAIGLGGIYVNVKGRERQGIVDKGDYAELKKEIVEKMLQVTDSNGAHAATGMTDCAADMKGPYRHDGPDLMVGFAEGYRVSWDCAKGLVTPDQFEDNTKSWSGDHIMDPRIVPGILFTNLKIEKEETNLMDMGPTVLDLFGIKTPPHMVGKSILS